MMLEIARTITPPDWISAPETQAVMAALREEGAPFSDGPQALFVGGCVRNQLLGLPVSDIDIATKLTPPAVQERLAAAGIKAVPTGIDHGTITAVCGGKAFEITSLRRDVATDGRRAVVSFTQDWCEDARRRDFTINTLLAAPDGRVYDPTGSGLADLEAGRVVFVGAPSERIAEDYLRILRFFRFHAFYGKGAPDSAALAACRAAGGQISTLSRERITHEYFKILSVDDPVGILRIMFDNNILSSIAAPEYDPGVLTRLCQLQKQYGAADILTRLAVLAGLDRNYINQLSSYLVLSNQQKKSFVRHCAGQAAFSGLSEKQAIYLIYKYGFGDALQAVLLFAARHEQAELPEQLAALVDFMRHVSAPVFPLRGDDVLAAGIEKGPQVGALLSDVEKWWIAGGFTADRAACLARLEAIKSGGL